MLELFSPETTIVLGLNLEEGEQSLVDTAVSLAQRTGSRLILAHATQPFRAYSLAAEGFALPYEEFEREAFEAVTQTAREKLQTIRDSLPDDLVVEILVQHDYPEDALESVAIEANAQLIICGYSLDKNLGILKGLSTAFSLMAHASLPIMTIPYGTYVPFADKAHKVLVADNLREEGFLALKAALGFSKSIDTDELIHLHVHRSNEADMRDMVEQVKLAMLEGRLPANPDFSYELYVDRIRGDIEERLRQRLHDAYAEFALGTRYRPTVGFGEPAEVIHRTIDTSHARILVFGRHHFFRPKGLRLGKVPYQAMIERHVATIVIPDRTQGEKPL